MHIFLSYIEKIIVTWANSAKNDRMCERCMEGNLLPHE